MCYFTLKMRRNGLLTSPRPNSKLKDHVEPTRLGFLPYHYLLVSTSQAGYLKYQDTSTGTLIKEQRTRLGACNVLEINQQNGIVHLGHQNGGFRWLCASLETKRLMVGWLPSLAQAP